MAAIINSSAHTWRRVMNARELTGVMTKHIVVNHHVYDRFQLYLLAWAPEKDQCCWCTGGIIAVYWHRISLMVGVGQFIITHADSDGWVECSVQSVCPQRNSETNDPGVFTLGVGIGIYSKWYALGVKRSKVRPAHLHVSSTSDETCRGGA